mgnify:CR=1 FL=1
MHCSVNRAPTVTVDGLTTTWADPACAESFGIAGFRPDSADDLYPTLMRALEVPGPSLVEVPVDYRENLRSEWADMKNTGGRAAGTVNAALATNGDAAALGTGNASSAPGTASLPSEPIWRKPPVKSAPASAFVHVGNGNNIIYVDPVLKGEEYDITRVVTEVFPVEVQEVYAKYKDSLPVQQNSLRLSHIQVKIKPGARVRIGLTDLTDGPAALLVTSDNPVVAERIDKLFGSFNVRVIDWQLQNLSLFKALELEKLAMGVILLLIVIVCDMLITGFDAPVEQVMYLDSPLKEHTLLQAIARVKKRRKLSAVSGLSVGIWSWSGIVAMELRSPGALITTMVTSQIPNCVRPTRQMPVMTEASRPPAAATCWTFAKSTEPTYANMRNMATRKPKSPMRLTMKAFLPAAGA